MRVLFVEDEKRLALAIEALLRQEGLEVDIADTEALGFDMASSNAYDCAIVDVTLPDGNGFELVSNLRSVGCTTPVLMLTARNEVNDRVAGLNAGADDYMGKPFDKTELVARLHALIRRASLHQADDQELRLGNVVLHRKSRTLSVRDKVLQLSSKEFLLMEFFFMNPNQTLTRDQLIYHVWGYDAEVVDNALDTYIYFLRKKCKSLGLKNVIDTVRGAGYRLGLTDE